MTVSSPSTSLRNDPPASPVVTQAQQRAQDQWLACLALSGDRARLLALLDVNDGRASEQASIRCHLALALARDRDTRGALEHLRAVLASNPANETARQIGFKLLLSEATSRARSEDWTGFSDVLTEAVALASTDGSADAALQRYGNTLPVAFIRTGRRLEAAKHWEQRLKARPNDLPLLHNLALLYYWWSVHEEGQPKGEPQWPAAIAYTTALAECDVFWSGWKQRRERAWGAAMSDDECTAIRTAMIDERLHRRFRDKSDEFSVQNKEDDARRQQEFWVLALREQQSARCWREATDLVATVLDARSAGRAALLALPGGYLFFERFGLLPEIRRCIDTLISQGLEDRRLADLRVLYSAGRLGVIAVLIDQFDRADEALGKLDALPEPLASSVDVGYLRAKAQIAKAGYHASRGDAKGALDTWKAAQVRAAKLQKEKATPRVFVPLIQAMLDGIGREAVKVLQKEAARLKAEKKLDEAIALLEGAQSLDPGDAVKELICIYYSDRGWELANKDKYGAARNEFQAALKVNPNYKRAKSGLSLTYNNEGVDKKDPEAGIPLFEKALSYDPDNERAKRNLANAYNNKGVRILNGLNAQSRYSLCDTAIEAFRKAAKLLNPDIENSTLDVLELVGSTNPDQVDGMVAAVKDDLYKNVLKHIAISAKFRKQLRGF